MNVIPIRPDVKPRRSLSDMQARKEALEIAIAAAVKIETDRTAKEKVLERRRDCVRAVLARTDGQLIENSIHLKAARTFIDDKRAEYYALLIEMDNGNGA